MGNIDIVRQAYDAFGRGDLPTVLGLMDDRIEWREAENNPYQPSGDAWIGPDAIVEHLFSRLVAEWDAFTVNPHRFHDAGDLVIVEGRYGGTYTATGRSFDGQFCHVFTLRDGRIVAFQQYTDTAQMQTVVGQGAEAKPVTA